MTYYIIKSTEPGTYVLDRTKMDYPAHVIDLRVGLTYVLENNYSEKIIIGGASVPKQVIAVMYATVSADRNSFLECMTEAEYEEAISIPNFTHMAMTLVDEEEDINSSSSLRESTSFEHWSKIAILGDSVTIDT